ncbi:hypothetical protein [Streptomyces acidiscabies]|uniref:Uncharacterized protein n=1 Tax=Streptomyces acidiscabies TaxID=42234 RepID=A0A0L0K8P0_9ACTN|nr:hypothetical protein [Streptomyces acidiscabies]KND34153.1 hypothetical protein IQ63_17015 [Streptomyces acidiscabies]
MLSGGSRPGFWCECTTRNFGGEGPVRLVGSYDAYTEAEADRWVSTILRTISPGLDADASQQASVLLRDRRIDTRRALLNREACAVSITHADTRITWTIRPVAFLPLAHRQPDELPPCAHQFHPHPAE